MESHLGSHFRKARLAKGLSLGQLARLVGYKNVSKGCRRIAAFERTGRTKPELFSKMTSILGIVEEVIEELLGADRQEWERWADDPNQPKPYLVVRLLAAIYTEESLPDGVTREEAEQVASQVAADRAKTVCLVWSRRTTVWFGRDGNRLAVRESTPDFDWRPRAWIK